jgi:hypothetical protein
MAIRIFHREEGQERKEFSPQRRQGRKENQEVRLHLVLVFPPVLARFAVKICAAGF